MDSTMAFPAAKMTLSATVILVLVLAASAQGENFSLLGVGDGV